MMPDVVALGDVNIDIIAHVSSYPAKGQEALAHAIGFQCGGSAANTAMALARLGREVLLIARLGADPLARKALDSLTKAGVSTAALQRDPAEATGLMYIVVTPDGERTMLGHRGANVFTDPNQIREHDFQQARLFHLSGYALLTEPQRSAALLALEIACRHDLTVTLDPGMALPQAGLDEIRALLPVVNFTLPSLVEAQRLTGQATPEQCAEALLAAGTGVVAIKLGKEGCLIATDQGRWRVPGFSVQARDTTGAGDYFAAGVIAGFLGGLDWRSAALLGNALGALAATRVGAGTSVPGPTELLDLLRSHQGSSPPEAVDPGFLGVDSTGKVIDFLVKLTTERDERRDKWSR
jgi:ribokinase